jgi:hypothetical protein
MEGSSGSSLFLSFLPISILSLACAVVANVLAREKGQRVVVWTALGLIPIINFVCLYYFIGAANLRFEKKLDRVLAALGEKE